MYLINYLFISDKIRIIICKLFKFDDKIKKMIKLFDRITLFLSGNNKDLKLEYKIFNIGTGIASIACYISLISNLIVGYPLIFHISLFIGGSIFALFFYLSVYKNLTHYLEIPLQAIAIGVLVLVYFFNDGLEGTGTFYFLLLTFAFIYSNTKKKYWHILFLYLLLASILMVIHFVYPEFIVKYSTNESRMLDFSTTLIIAISIIGVMTIMFKQSYDKEREVVKLQSEELKELNATKDKLFSIISHDLKNPFNNLLCILRQILENMDHYSSLEIREHIKMLEQSSKRGYELLENLLEWSMSQRGRIQYNPTHLNIYEVVKECLLVTENQIFNKNISLHINIDKDAHINADYNMLKTVLRNLLTNAIKYSNSEGNIYLSSEIHNKEVEITIKDEGVGIDKDDLDKLFKIDIKHSTPGTANEHGTGLGLILCYEFVKKHNGKIWVESQKNKGTTFKVSIPQ